ncbi:MAG: response regulator, partial [Chlorobium sp.]|nr:response regulator [Chlorobium sp.]
PTEALRQAEKHAENIDLLITDVIMPEMNGKALSHRLLELVPGIKVMYMSGYTANVIAHHGILDEGINFLQKPFSRRELAAKIREILDTSS